MSTTTLPTFNLPLLRPQVKLGDAQEEAAALRAKLRLAESESTHADLFDAYEAEINKLQREVLGLREKQLQWMMAAENSGGAASPGALPAAL